MKKLTSQIFSGILAVGLALNAFATNVAHAEYNEEIAMNMAKISAGAIHNLVIDADGDVWSWGSTSNGILGIGDTGRDKYRLPTKIEDLSNVIAVSASDTSSLALKEDGTVWAWGTKLGDGRRYSESDVPVQVPGLENVVSISTGYSHNMVLKEDGTVWAWGTIQRATLVTGARWMCTHLYK